MLWNKSAFVNSYVILIVFYLLILIISYKFSIHFHPRLTLGE
nr:MAG TPA: hypothetical protein [Caudoviricetes sp.]DAI25954.1 MAG TPA: hypothetical protein [Caudoviricetes sp.]DAY00909.1 MAG TPA: hypothetical protein [Caudoviricetes sp.]